MPFNNYEAWRFSTQNYLIIQGLFGYVDGSESQPSTHNHDQPGYEDQLKNWMMKNAIALQVIKLTCGAEMLPHIAHEELAKAAWDKLGAANYAQHGTNTGNEPANYAQPAGSNDVPPADNAQPAGNNTGDVADNNAQPAGNDTGDEAANIAQPAGNDTGGVPANNAQVAGKDAADYVPANNAQPVGDIGDEPTNFPQPGNYSGGEPASFVQSGNNTGNEVSNCPQPGSNTGDEPAYIAHPGNSTSHEPANYAHPRNNTGNEPSNNAPPGNNTSCVPSNDPQPGNNTNGVPAVIEQTEEEHSYTHHAALYQAIHKNDLESVNVHLRDNPNAVTARITSTGETALHIAAVSGRFRIMELLLQLMPIEALEIKNKNGSAAIALTAQEGSIEIAKLMVEKNINVLRLKDGKDNIPLVLAATNGNEGMLRYLYSVTPKDELDPKSGKNGATFLTAAVSADIYDVSLEVLQRYPQLAIAPDSDGNNVINVLSAKPCSFPSGNRHGFLQQFIYTSIPVELDYLSRAADPSGHSIQISSEPKVQTISKARQHGLVWKALILLVPGVKKIYEKKVIHVQALELLRVVCLQISKLNVQQLLEARAYDAIVRTARFGIIEYFKELLDSSPNLIFCVDVRNSNVGLFQVAVLNRQDKIHNFISKMGQKNNRAHVISDSGNTMLHLAGFLAPPSQLDRVSGAALQMQREIQWFQEVEKMVQPKFKDILNKDLLKPSEVFRNEHKALVKEGEAWMKETSQACMVVSTLIATVMFAAAFTVPARYAEQDFLRSLPQKLILGLASLFISIAAMMTTFGATLVIILHGNVTWAYVPVTMLASVPVLLFGFLQFPLFVDIILSTYGPSIFHKQKNIKKE
ncbi:uncharacterized protein LOC113358721 isoform X2 [Papaver somniferum]|uniref:uncharacterized protein LOC113358721 isoform X2 n=1 Tax=Papaver somniferum TaxID=3469 RepID=UPI000E6FC79B|nr:uncharacterized protein LOC113358721 isoform X2 [Papaver somniferum]